jgi:HD superfamily phosphohydrolase
MNKRKIFNDPIYGLITLPSELVFDLIEHRYFQRLRRITQLGLTHYVYPGALHTRFHHAIGAMHLTTKSIEVLRAKGVEITAEEAEALTVAVLLHDIGHAPFSHALEHTLLNVHHETLSIAFMQALNTEFDGRLTMAIEIFCDKHPKKFLHQLVSGQLDMDRMDYLNRDSYFTGVHEGVIGYDRIIQMLNVANNQLVVEEKGIFSIEKFLIARRLMYWQVYLHKTVVAAEQMLIHALLRAKEVKEIACAAPISDALRTLLNVGTDFDFNTFEKTNLLNVFAELDDVDIIGALKAWSTSQDTVLALLSKGLIQRKLFKVQINDKILDLKMLNDKRKVLENELSLSQKAAKHLIIQVTEANKVYDKRVDEIRILYKDNKVIPMSQSIDYELSSHKTAKHFLCSFV